MIDNNSIENLKARLDIVDVVGHYIELKKNGANWKCVCPFHDDSNPSLVVSPSKQIYHCFSCGAGGDPIRFVMEYEKLSYPESLEKLASMYNFSLDYTSDDGKIKEDRKLLENINMYFRKNLDAKTDALKYIKDRGIGEASIEKFELGYAPSSPENLNFLSSNGYNIAEAIEAGVAGTGENGRNYARFIERITFPIRSVSGKIVGFGGRTISGHQAKYVNSPQTKLFNKSYLLYGYNFAKESIYQTKSIIITEGYLDVIMLHQAGFTNAVATLGTALTKEHIPLISRGNPKVILAYDGDNAGVAAALKAALMLSTVGISGGVVLFTEGMDPADMVQHGQSDKLNKLFHNPQPFIEFAIDKIVKKYNLQDPLEKQKALEEGSSYLKTLPSSIANSYAGMLSGSLNINPNLVKVQTHQSNRLKQQKTAFEDTLELTIIKTLLTKPNFIDTLLDTIDVNMFKTHNMELSKLLQNEKEDPSLRRILLRDDIKVYDEDELIASMINFLISFYHNELTKVKSSNMDYKNKSFAIRKIQENIFKLKQGKLVQYESLSTI
ncbi:DNA primase [Sulfurospirillum arcachonense]|uniref:DNA primase n=1 Tax=Sulfurospirillum arcachonense TaxID=57666 RepID=UPI00046A8D62|nr:DNA primase [Sulfurospirillum arcachonense]